MKAAVLYAPNEPFAVQDVELAEPRPDEVLVRVAASGVCHSDLHIVEGAIPYPMPVVLGHEGAGIVERVGPAVTSVKPGDHVITLFVPVCGRCYHCSVGRPNLCAGFRVPPGTLGDATRRLTRDGREINHFAFCSTFAEFAVVPQGGVVKVRADAPLDKICLIGCGVMTGVGAAINTAKVRPGSTCVVIGCGGVGLNIIQGARLAGAARIIAIDVLPFKLELAQAFGATHVIDASKDDVTVCVRELSRRGADYAFEAIGKTETIELAYALTGRGGTTVVVGLARPGDCISIPANQFMQEKSLVGSAYGSARPHADMPALVDLYMEGRLKLDELVTRTYALDEIDAAFEALRQGQVARGVIKYGS